MRKFKSAKQTQRFLSSGELIYQQTPRHQLLAAMTREMMKEVIQNLESNYKGYCLPLALRQPLIEFLYLL